MRTFGSGRRVRHVEIDGFRGNLTHFGTKQSHRVEDGKRVRSLSSLIGINGDTPQLIY